MLLLSCDEAVIPLASVVDIPPVVCGYEIVNFTKTPLQITYATIDKDSFTRKYINVNASLTFFTTENINIGKLKRDPNLEVDSAYPFRKLLIYPDSFSHTYSEYLDHKPQFHSETFDRNSGLYKLVSAKRLSQSEIINFYMVNRDSIN